MPLEHCFLYSSLCIYNLYSYINVIFGIKVLLNELTFQYYLQQCWSRRGQVVSRLRHELLDISHQPDSCWYLQYQQQYWGIDPWADETV